MIICLFNSKLRLYYGCSGFYMIGGDEECIQILRNCRETILDEDQGKVLIAEVVIKEDEEHRFKVMGLMLDMVMMAHTTNGQERTIEEWGSILSKVGFNRFTVKPNDAVQSVIIAYP
ncbi:hypothetical protein IFM89_009375 [Coptis chinensis]|uniref:O-methyltransferase C-terminal domain-containing protein n=1 Tax=Coptis chinensis TaxID=261450 RepID=A0A835LMI9_9MAGN|nr:hypothetical protein IFM89_009375 [Coptis chinensis]